MNTRTNLHNISVLVADDNPDNLRLIERLLTENDAFVRVALNGEAVVQSARKNPPDIILMDVHMPKMDGYEACKILKQDEITASIPVIFVSAMDDVFNKRIAFEVGAADYITKPIETEEMLIRIRNHWELARSRSKLEEHNKALQEHARLREDCEVMARHDLGAPLNAIVGLSEILLEDDNLDDRQKRMIKAISDAGYNVTEVLGRSLDILKMERSAYEMKPEDVDLLREIRRVVRELEPFAQSKSVSFDVPPATEASQFFIRGERLLCHTILANLCTNALEAAPNGSDVQLKLSKRGEWVELCIENAGEVPEDIREDFFEKYCTFGKEGGTGLGTYSAKLMTETQGGKISLDSSTPGRTRVLVNLLAVPEVAMAK